jgi:hypothetical protein
MKSKKDLGGLIFVGCMFAGMGFGYLMGHMVGGMFIGMGVGFIGRAILVLSDREKENIDHQNHGE